MEHDTTNGKLKGFYVDLMDQLSVIGNFTYTLNEFYINENAAINDLVRKHPSGLMLELNRQVSFKLSPSPAARPTHWYESIIFFHPPT